MKTTRPVLGRGLSALIPAPASPATRDYLLCPLDQIHLPPDQPRRTFHEPSLEELAASIREKGVLQPVVVARQPDGYRLIAGERRLRAARLAGLQAIPAVVRDVASAESFELALVENIQREDLDAIDEARAYRHLIDSRGYSQEELARRVGKDRSTVANALRLLLLPADMQHAVADGRLTPGHARALLSLPDPEARERLYAEALARELSVRELERRARELRLTPEPAPPPTNPLSPLHETVAAELAERFDVPVRLVPRSGRRGRIVIDYDSLEALRRIHALCMGRPTDR